MTGDGAGEFCAQADFPRGSAGEENDGSCQGPKSDGCHEWATCGSGGDAVFQWDLSACCAAPWSLLRQGDPSDLGKAQPWTNSQEFPR